MITIEVSENGERVEIILDRNGTEELLSQIVNARSTGDAHLRAPSWAGQELEEVQSSTKQNVKLAKELTIRVF